MKSIQLNDYSVVKAKKRFRGVFKCGQKYKAQIQIRGAQMYLGLFDTDKEAAQAYDAQAIIHLGCRAKLNFPNNHKVKIADEVRYIERPRFKKRLYVGKKVNSDLLIQTETRKEDDEQILISDMKEEDEQAVLEIVQSVVPTPEWTFDLNEADSLWDTNSIKDDALG